MEDNAQGWAYQTELEHRRFEETYCSYYPKISNKVKISRLNKSCSGCPAQAMYEVTIEHNNNRDDDEILRVCKEHNEVIKMMDCESFLKAVSNKRLGKFTY